MLKEANLLDSVMKFGSCSADSYPYHLSINTEKDDNNPVPLRKRVVNKMARIIKDHSDPIIYEIYFKFLLQVVVY